MYTKRIIAESMFYLLKVSSFEKISVQTLLDHCGVSRSTFYRYFRDKYDLMNWCYQDYVDTILTKSGNERLILIFQFLDDNHTYFEKAAKVEGKNSFLDFLYNYTYHLYEHLYLTNTGQLSLSSEVKVALQYTCAGSVFILEQWLNGGRRESVMQMAEWTLNNMPEMFRRYM